MLFKRYDAMIYYLCFRAKDIQMKRINGLKGKYLHLLLNNHIKPQNNSNMYNKAVEKFKKWRRNIFRVGEVCICTWRIEKSCLQICWGSYRCEETAAKI